jgi:nicotinamidase-related amidase
MAEWERETRSDYEKKGFARRSGYGRKPALLIVDFINGFTNPATPLGGDFSSEVAVTAGLLKVFRAAALPVVFTTVVYEPDLSDGGVFIKKVPSLGILTRGSPMVDVDERIRPQSGEYVVEKKFASSFFGTDLDSYLKSRGVDTLVITGCTTSGCVRASAVDSLQYGYITLVVSDGVGDRAPGPHEANLFDIDAKYGDVVPSSDVHAYLKSITSGGGFAERVQAEFGDWWNEARRARR